MWQVGVEGDVAGWSEGRCGRLEWREMWQVGVKGDVAGWSEGRCGRLE